MTMTPGVDDWTETEARLVAQALLRAQNEVAPGPVPWASLRARRRSSTLKRWTATGLAVAAGAAGVLAVDLSGADGFLRHDVVSTVPGAGAPAGSLVADPEMMSEVRRQAVAAVGGPVEVLVATQVSDSRLILVRTTGASDSRLIWLLGAARPPYLLHSGNECGTSDAFCWNRFGDGVTLLPDPQAQPASAPAQANGVVVVARPGSAVRVTGGADVTAEGRVIRPVKVAQERWPGVFVAELPTVGGRVDVEATPSNGGTTARDWSSIGYSGDPEAHWTLTPAASQTAGGVVDPMVRADLVVAAEQATLMPMSNASTVLWSAQSHGWARVLFSMRAPAGGRVLVAVQRRETGATSFALTVDALRPFAADGPDAFAWRWAVTPASLAPQALVQLVGPSSSVRALGMTASGGATPVTLNSGVGQLADDGITTVAFLDRAGREVARTDVAPAWPTGGVLGG